MARLRTLKPGFFQNETLAEVAPLGRLLFAGLWTIADREGRLEDRPARIKAQVLPYDDCDADALLDALAAHGFILRYTADGQRYIEVCNFWKHQTPHIKESASTIPAPDNHHASTSASTPRVSVSPVSGIGNLELGSGNLELDARARASSPPRKRALTTAMGRDFAPLVAAFAARGLSPPNLRLDREQTAGRTLLDVYSPDDIAIAWATLDTSDGFDRGHLSLELLTRQNRIGNILAGRYRPPGEDSHAPARPESQRPPTDNPELRGLEKYSG